MQQTVLFVDDDPHLLDGLKRGLHGAEFRVLAAPDAESALNLLQREGVNLVVSDEHMPGIPGIEFLSQARRLFPGTIRILLTGVTDPTTVIQAVNTGILFRYLVKPCCHDELLSAVRQGLWQHALMERCRQALFLVKQQNALVAWLREHHPTAVQEAATALTKTTFHPDAFDSLDDLATLLRAQCTAMAKPLPD